MAEYAPETFGFKSEVRQLLHLMIHSLYSNREIFLRELIANASDAVERLRIKSLSDPTLIEGEKKNCLKIWVDKEKKQVILSDYGCGMTRDEVIEHLGTIAHSGTRRFLDAVQVDQGQANSAIGQFGVGFYSAFTVAHRVTVHTRAAGHPEESGVLWSCDGEGTFTVDACPKWHHGTEVTLFLRDDAGEFLQEWSLRRLIKQYANHLALPIELQVHEDGDALKFEQINRGEALWTRPKKEISEQEYREFYKELSHDHENPLCWSHHRAEGLQEYTLLLYLPSAPGFKFWDKDEKEGIKLYVQRVFIMEDSSCFLPPFLRFVRGVIDSQDLPLNVSRELIQQSKVTAQLKAACTKRAFELIETLALEAPDRYHTLWDHFGRLLKLGISERSEYKTRILPLLRFSSTASKGSLPRVSLPDYVERMRPDQEAIYVLVADHLEAAKQDPHLEWFQKEGFEVLFLTEKLDAWLLTYLTCFNEKPIKNIASSDLKIDATPEASEEGEALIQKLKGVLGDRVQEVRLNTRLLSAPCAVTTASDALSARMAKLLSEAGRSPAPVKFSLEINPAHPLLKKVAQMEGQALGQWAHLLLHEALLAEQGSLDNPHDFIRSVNTLLEQLPSPKDSA